jgi:hypothetical protein
MGFSVQIGPGQFAGTALVTAGFHQARAFHQVMNPVLVNESVDEVDDIEGGAEEEDRAQGALGMDEGLVEPGKIDFPSGIASDASDEDGVRVTVGGEDVAEHPGEGGVGCDSGGRREGDEGGFVLRFVQAGFDQFFEVREEMLFEVGESGLAVESEGIGGMDVAAGLLAGGAAGTELGDAFFRGDGSEEGFLEECGWDGWELVGSGMLIRGDTAGLAPGLVGGIVFELGGEDVGGEGFKTFRIRTRMSGPKRLDQFGDPTGELREWIVHAVLVGSGGEPFRIGWLSATAGASG